MQAEVVIDGAATIGVAVCIRAPVVAPAAEPEPEVKGVVPPHKCLGRDGRWLTNLKAQAEVARGTNLGCLRTTCAGGQNGGSGQREKQEVLHGPP